MAALDVIALLCLAVAGFLIAPAVGFGAVGVSLLLVSRAMTRRRGGGS